MPVSPPIYPSRYADDEGRCRGRQIVVVILSSSSLYHTAKKQREQQKTQDRTSVGAAQGAVPPAFSGVRNVFITIEIIWTLQAHYRRRRRRDVP